MTCSASSVRPGTLHAYTDEQREALNAATGSSGHGHGSALYAAPIYGGQIQRNIIGERALGLPKNRTTTR